MEGIHRAYIMRIDRNSAGVKIPFDKVYLFHKNDKETLPKIFRDALVFPITQHWVEQIQKVIGPGGSGVAAYKAFAFNRFGEDYLIKHVVKHNPVEGIEEEQRNYYAVVPVLFTKYGCRSIKVARRRGRKKVASYPAYLIARPTQMRTVALAKRLLSARSYFLLDGRAIRPICLMCPRHQYFIQGQCTLGELDCYTHLAQARPNDMVRGAALYEKYMTRINEPEIELSTKTQAEVTA